MSVKPRPALQVWPGTEISSGDIPTLAYRTVPVADIEAGRAIKKSLIEGYRSLGTASIFAAGVESQCIGLVTDAANNANPKLMEIANALLLVGLLLSSFGTALAFLTANWYEYLEGVQLEALAYRWAHAKQILMQADDKQEATPVAPPAELKSQRCSWTDYMVSTAISSVLSVIML
ncbi:transmembrane protein, putative, partial [Rhizoctonia solani AG-3 Rhs1AP]